MVVDFRLVNDDCFNNFFRLPGIEITVIEVSINQELITNVRRLTSLSITFAHVSKDNRSC